jgi:cytidine deaminase
MKKFELICTINEFNSIAELNQTDAMLIDEANKALESAYAPYSEFRVGCALLLEDGTVVRGNNQENAAYPSGLCAERVAFFYAAANYPDKKIIAAAITTANQLKEPVAPCGACRQVMAEYELKQNSKIRLVLSNSENHIYVINSIAELLPLQFILKH